MRLSPPSLVNGQEVEDRGTWDSGMMSVCSADSVVVSGSNMGPGAKVLLYQQSAPIHRTTQEGFEEIYYFEPLSSKAKCIGLGPGLVLGPCTCCCWDSMLRPRSFFKVTENAVETNHPMLLSICCLEMCVIDWPSKTYFDKFGTPFHSTMCSPYHCCFCISLCGDVVGVAPHPACANIVCQCLLPCFFKFYPGVENAPKVVEAVKAARDSRMSRGDMNGGSAVGNAMQGFGTRT